MLHIVNKSPLERNALESCLRVAQGGALLLTEDAVYAATRGNAAARGMTDGLIEGVASVDYAGFVDLVAEYPTSQSWL